ncbi:MAG: SDR family oxidoreductase [Phycisphaerae bacterium]|nr:SDR family oxidoreductase [Phycisphaerae bacterium]
MRIDLSGKRALVGGATRGIGLACAHALADAGAEITVAARDLDALRKLAIELARRTGRTHSFLAVDMTKPEMVREAAAGLVEPGSPIHILIHNTGGPPAGTAIDATESALIEAFTAHVVSGQILVRALAPGMREAGYGRIINIVSTSVKQPIPGLGVSNTVRGAVNSWAKTLSAELGPWGITVNSVLPGYTDTDRLRALIRSRAAKAGVTEAEVERSMIAEVPAGRFARPEETAVAVAFLASPLASYVSGTSLAVDGGKTVAL